jgi:hypothetical protein
MSFTKILVAIASITVYAASLPCHAQVVPSSSVQLSIPAKYSYRAMIATFTPPGGLTLAAYATKLGYIGFNWQQTITNWPSPNLKCDKCGPDGTSMLIVPTVPTGTFPPFLDPVVTGYTYNPCGGKPSGSSGMAYPFYFTPTGDTDCWSLVNNETSTTLTFGDEPMDHELTSAEIDQDNVPKFMTDLVGITMSDGVLVPSAPLFYWTWQTTYNGSVGSVVTATTANSPLYNPGQGGTGRVTITSINGIPVPEPAGLFLLIPGTLAILAAHWGVGRRRRTPKMIRS